MIKKSQLKQANKYDKDISYTIRNKIWLSTRNIIIN